MIRYVPTLVLGLLIPVTAEAQTVRFDRLVTISVAADGQQGISQQTIEIVTDPPIRNATLADLHDRVWTATRVLGSRRDTIRSDTCPQLRMTALSFTDLPPLPIRPVSAHVGGDLPIGPTMKDGYSTSLTFDTLAADFGLVTVQLGGWGAYQQWGREAVSQLQTCWPTE